jgi:hypothetical protein
VRRAFWVSRELDLKLTKKGLVDTVFWFTLAQHNKIYAAELARQKLKIDPRLLKLILRINIFMNQIKAEKEVAVGIVEVMFKKNPQFL